MSKIRLSWTSEFFGLFSGGIVVGLKVVRDPLPRLGHVFEHGAVFWSRGASREREALGGLCFGLGSRKSFGQIGGHLRHHHCLPIVQKPLAAPYDGQVRKRTARNR